MLGGKRMTVKSIANIYIDADVKERHQIAGTNISAVCNEFLKTYFLDEEVNETRDNEKEIQVLRSKLAQANARVVAETQIKKVDDDLKRKESLAVAIIKLRQLNIKKQNGSLIAGESYNALFDATMERFDMTREGLVAKVF